MRQITLVKPFKTREFTIMPDFVSRAAALGACRAFVATTGILALWLAGVPGGHRAVGDSITGSPALESAGSRNFESAGSQTLESRLLPLIRAQREGFGGGQASGYG